MGSGDRTQVLELPGRHFMTMHLPALPLLPVGAGKNQENMEELEVPSSRTYNLTLTIYPEKKKKNYWEEGGEGGARQKMIASFPLPVSSSSEGSSQES